MGTEVTNGSEGKGAPSWEGNGSPLKLVSLDESGEGLPYAPENWPNPGDNWAWRVGKRVSLNGNYVDRYLYLPKRLHTSEVFSSRRGAFASKLSVSRYLEQKFPGTDIGTFFASFHWKIPAKRGTLANGHAKGGSMFSLPTNEQIEQYLYESVPGGCKAGNKSCVTVTDQSEESTTTTTTTTTTDTTAATMNCDLCCSEPRFCRDCCCILCCKSVDYGLGGYTFVKCEAAVAGEGGRVCAHLCHLSCALRSYMAGKVGGTIGLDAEYFCRRCDAKTDLVPKVAEMMRTCEALDSLDHVEKVLKLGAGVLRGSERSRAKGLLSRVELVISKINSGTCLEDIWKVEDDSNLSTDTTNHGIAAMEIEADQDPMDIHSDSPDMSARVDWLTESLKLEEEIDHALLGLRKSQEIEYKLAEDRLYDQKNYITSLYQQLEIERSELSRHASLTDRQNLLSIVMNRVDLIKQELAKLKDMEKVARGFGKTSRAILEELFGLDIEG